MLRLVAGRLACHAPVVPFPGVKPDEAKKWQAERAKYPDATPPPREKK
jgi:hypothetical protein